MRKWIQGAAVAVALLSSRVAQAQPYNFLVDYFGNNNAVQASGSDNIIGTNIQPSDSFFWRILAVGGQWRTTAPVSQFPFMAFQVNECGNRLGDYTLNLFSGSTNVLSETAANVPHSCIHLGTNTVDLPTDLVWDRMELQFTLTSADSFGVPIGSTISSLLPVYGAPEFNSSNPGEVVYEATATVPEPTTIVLMGLGLGIVGVVARKRRS